MFGRNPRNTVPPTSHNPIGREPSGLGQQPGAVRSPIQNISGPGPSAPPVSAPPVSKPPTARKASRPPFGGRR